MNVGLCMFSTNIHCRQRLCLKGFPSFLCMMYVFSINFFYAIGIALSLTYFLIPHLGEHAA